MTISSSTSTAQRKPSTLSSPMRLDPTELLTSKDTSCFPNASVPLPSRSSSLAPISRPPKVQRNKPPTTAEVVAAQASPPLPTWSCMAQYPMYLGRPISTNRFATGYWSSRPSQAPLWLPTSTPPYFSVMEELKHSLTPSIPKKSSPPPPIAIINSDSLTAYPSLPAPVRSSLSWTQLETAGNPGSLTLTTAQILSVHRSFQLDELKMSPTPSTSPSQSSSLTFPDLEWNTSSIQSWNSLKTPESSLLSTNHESIGSSMSLMSLSCATNTPTCSS